MDTCDGHAEQVSTCGGCSVSAGETAGGHTEHRPAGESDPATCVGHKTIMPRERSPTRKSVRVLHAHTALQESELARSGGGARARPAGVGAGLPAKAGDRF